MKIVSAKFVLVIAATVAAWPLMAQTNPSAATPAQTITIHAKKYEFIPAEITLKKDQTVKLELTSEDVEHSLEIPALGVNSIMKKGEVTDVDVTPTKTGDFKGKCGKFCGLGHRKMRFLVHVVN
ncbi:MAG: cupredoxin domain-containing protein [Acidobacteriaceae bacterium]